ncbi:unnamed protein product, partial [Adineta steineri]
IIQNATDQLLNIHTNIVNARLLTPISNDNINEKYFQTLWESNPDEYHYITILSDILPILLALIHDGKVNGHIDVCNKGKISLKDFEKNNSNELKSQTNISQIIETEDITDKFEKWTKQMISPETRQLYQASFL